MKHITIGFSIHRPEVVDLIADLMKGHEAIYLEEPPQPEFQDMLAGALPVDDYLMSVDIEYPIFSRRMCQLMRKFYDDGTKIVQVEPFLQHLLDVHDFFSRGHRPEELKPDTLQHQVYVAERDATKALLKFYETVIDGSFDAAVSAVMRFARADAARFRLRDALRAGALSTELTPYASAYVEAGSIHYGLYQQLKKKLPAEVRVKPVFIDHQALKIIGRRGHLYGPGDQLTLRYILDPNSKNTDLEKRLAARSLVYTKLVEKEELSADLATFPHVRNEFACIQAVQQLTLADCHRLFPLIRLSKSVTARYVVDDYLRRFKKQAPPEKMLSN
ncbi:MAG: hypothetical protein R3274_04660 [Desulfobacterales bacterium]|nr:hypothetical protein [Desulfobacterales bacterium]